MPRISVIIPTFNRAWCLLEAVNSVLKQSFEDFELLIIDDGSSDETQALLKQLSDPRVRVFQQENKGVSAARNLGIKEARSSWLAFLDSDDQWHPEKLSCQWDYLGQSPKIKILHTHEQWIRRGKKVNQKKKHQKFGGDIFQQCLPLCLISPSSVIIHQDVFKRVGHFREDFPVCEDYDLWLRITSLYQVGFLERPLVIKHGGHPDQLSQKLKAMDYFRVLALYSILKERSLGLEKFQAVKKECALKLSVLKKGYLKHGRELQYQEVLDIEKKVNEMVYKEARSREEESFDENRS